MTRLFNNGSIVYEVDSINYERLNDTYIYAFGFSISMDFDLLQNSKQNTSLERYSQELLNAYFSLEIGHS